MRNKKNRDKKRNVSKNKRNKSKKQTVWPSKSDRNKRDKENKCSRNRKRNSNYLWSKKKIQRKTSQKSVMIGRVKEEAGSITMTLISSWTMIWSRFNKRNRKSARAK